MTLLIDLAYLLAFAVLWPWLLIRRWRRGPSHSTLAERLGACPSRPVAGRCVWIHGVSLGEINAARTLVTELHRRSPGVVVVISSTTKTGLERARALYPNLVVFRYPLDLSFAIRRTLDRIRPTVIVLMELEIWPNLIFVARTRDISVVIANGRITAERSMRRFRWPIVRGLARRMFGQLRWVGAQDETYAARFRELGVPPERVEVVGSVKYDTADLADSVEGQDRLAVEMGIDTRRPLLVAGSTGPGEEAMLLDGYAALLTRFPGLQLALVPRDVKRFDEVAALIVARGFACLRRSTGRPIVPPGVVEPLPVFLGDSIGELRKFYGLASVVVIGRTFVPLGGSDMMEVAGLARAMVFGPHAENFAEVAALLLAADGAVQASSPAEATEQVAALLADPQRRATLGRNAQAVIAARRGATARTVERLLQFLG